MPLQGQVMAPVLQTTLRHQARELNDILGKFAEVGRLARARQM